MALTITNTTTTSISLVAGNNPVTLTGTNSFANTGTVTITGTSPSTTTVGFGTYFGIYGSAGGNWTITNTGTVRASGTQVVVNGVTQTGNRNAAIGIAGISGTGVATGTIVNTTGGLISSANRGVIGYGVITVDNRAGATIAGGTSTSVAVGLVGTSETLLNAGTISGSVVIAGNTNDPATVMTTGVITNSGQMNGGLTLNRRVVGTLTNSGTITGLGGSAGIVVSGTSTVDATNSAAGLIQGSTGFSLSGSTAASTITNSGAIIGTSSTGLSLSTGTGNQVTNTSGGTISGTTNGVALGGTSASFTNLSGGTISGSNGISISSSAALLSNSGQISGTVGSGVILTGAGISATNSSSGVITGTTNGITVTGSAAVLANFGQITGTTTGVRINGANASFTNTGTVSGTTGVYFSSGITGTLANQGIINATDTTAGYAVRFARTSNLNRLITNAYGVLGGKLSLGSGVLELVTNTASAIGTIAGFGGMVTNVGTVAIGTGAAWRLAGSSAGLTNVGINGFDTDDSILLTDFVAVSRSFDGSSLILTDASAATTTITMSGTFTTSAVLLSTGAGTTTISLIVCFAEGTRIRTPAGDVAIERLREGGTVVVASGRTRPVRWIGSRRMDLTRHPVPALVRPIRIAAGAFADGVPARDLRVSPDHALFIDGLLIPARLLINGGSIEQDTTCPAVTYYHVELDTHDVLLAEGLAAESYLDTGNRGFFANSGHPLILHPDMTGQTGRLAQSCAPFADRAEDVRPIWERLARRSTALGWRLDERAVTTDPDIRVQVAGRALRPVSVTRDRYRFILPPGCETVRLLSRASAPAEMQPWQEDRRRLGLSVRRITLREGTAVSEIALDDPALTLGWWAVERHDAKLVRWTDGDALLRVGGGSQSRVLEIVAGCRDAYPAEPKMAAEAWTDTPIAAAS